MNVTKHILVVKTNKRTDAGLYGNWWWCRSFAVGDDYTTLFV